MPDMPGICSGFDSAMKNVLKVLVISLFFTCVFFSVIHLRTYSFKGFWTCKQGKCGINKASKYDLRIIVIVYDRYWSLLRLLNSINNAEYGKDKVKLEVWIDRPVDGTVNQRTLHTAENFTFFHGDYSVNIHSKHVGIFGQWVSTWNPPENSSEIAVILEDDLTVSPYFYKYLKLVHNMYDDRVEINGYALQGGSIKHHVHDNSPLVGPKNSVVFLYPVLGTWGFSPNRRNWLKFTEWCFTAKDNVDFHPYVPDNIATNWFKKFEQEGTADSMWEIWHIYYAWRHNENTLYPNLEGLATNWQEKGLHYSGNEGGPTNKLLLKWKPEYEQLPKYPVHLDLKGQIIQNEH